MADNIKLIRLSEENWQDFRQIRLEALQTNPLFFLRSYEVEVALPDEYWQKYLTNQKCAIFGLYDGAEIIGVTGAFKRNENNEEYISFGMSFIKQEYRGRGLSALFYQTRLNWAKEQDGINRVIVSHRLGNNISRAANQNFGFVEIGQKETDFADGRATEVIYELKLDRK